MMNLLLLNSKQNPVTATTPTLQAVFAEDAETVASLGPPDRLGLGLGRLVESAEEMRRMFPGCNHAFELGRWVVVLT